MRPLQEFLATESSGAILILPAAALAMVWANVAPDSYISFWDVHVGPGTLGLDLSVRHWVNDVAMTLFFFVVGLEIKREVTEGELRRFRSVALPIVAAAGGMIVPAVLYLAFNAGGEGISGWGIPMATDIAFAVAVLTIAGRGLPGSLRSFLLTLAIADDIGAIVVIAVVYSAGLAFGWLVAAVVAAAVLLAFAQARVSRVAPYLLVGVVLWYATLRSGVHPTIAGVVLGLCIPAGVASAARLEHRAHPWSSYGVVPLFALANAGVVLRDAPEAIRSPVFLGVVAGLLAGKMIGIAGATFAAARLGLAPSPGPRMAVVGVSAVAGIGFTVSLFIAELAFDDPELTGAAKGGILVASVLAGGLGTVILRRAKGAGPGA